MHVNVLISIMNTSKRFLTTENPLSLKYSKFPWSKRPLPSCTHPLSLRLPFSSRGRGKVKELVESRAQHLVFFLSEDFLS